MRDEGIPMSTDPASAGTPGTANPAASAPAKPASETRQALGAIRSGVVVMWWGFFDWLAVVSSRCPTKVSPPP